MSGFGKKPEREGASPDPTKPKVLPPRPRENDDYEDGDIATPKRDRDDEQQDL